MNGESELRLSGIAVDCIIGEKPEERICEQRILVDAALKLRMEDAVQSDNLADTVDYALLAGQIRRRLQEAKCCLIEKAAAIALDECMACQKVFAAEVTVTKKGAVPGLDAAAVTMARTR